MLSLSTLKHLISETHNHAEKKKADLEKKRAEVEDAQHEIVQLEELNDKRRAEIAKQTPAAAERFTMYDSTVPTHIPPYAQAVAGYVNGRYENFYRLGELFPNAKRFAISVTATEPANILDVEAGDATPAQAGAWVKARHEQGVKRPIVYADLSTMPDVVDALVKHEIARDRVLLWVADYTGQPHIPAGYDACQWEDHDELYDVSLCEPWFGV